MNERLILALNWLFLIVNSPQKLPLSYEVYKQRKIRNFMISTLFPKEILDIVIVILVLLKLHLQSHKAESS